MITERHSMATLSSLPISFKNKTWCNFAEFSEGWGNIISFLAFGLFCDFSKGLYLVASFIGATPFGQNQKRQWPAVLAGEARQCGWGPDCCRPVHTICKLGTAKTDLGAMSLCEPKMR